MSQENVEMLRREYVRALREDWSLSAVPLAPDFQVVDSTLPEAAGPERGRDALRAARLRMSEVFADFGYEVEEAMDLGDCVLIRAHVFARGRGSGLELDGTMGHLWTFTKGAASRLDVFGTWDEALEAVGLRE
jgi:ketosteroid isomerase-like protein